MTRWPLWAPAWSPAVLILVMGVALRLWGLGEWSLWEDEETSIYFSFHPDSSFPHSFQTFFRLLGFLYRHSTDYVLAGRVLAASFGILSLVLTYCVARRFTGPTVALVALGVVVLSPGHLFWSQSIRYYGLVMCLQLIASWLFLESFSGRRAVLSVMSVATVAFAMTCHPSAVMIVPVFVTYSIAAVVRSGRSGRIASAATCLVAASLLLSMKASQLSTIVSYGPQFVLDSARNPAHLLASGVFYFGLPAVGLALVGAAHHLRSFRLDEAGFFALLAAVIPLELLALAAMNLVNVAYYYGLVALAGVGVLAGHGVQACGALPAWVRRTAWCLFAMYYVVVLGSYFGPAHGDRPRWREAASHITARSADSAGGPIYSQVPGVMAFYLGVSPALTMQQDVVKGWPAAEDAGYGWFVGEQRVLNPSDQVRLDARCDLSARFPSHMLIRDRTVVVYRCRAD